MSISPRQERRSAFVELDQLEKCTHCGFCLPTCPTYNELGVEMDSPRGRLYLMKSVLEGRSEPDEVFATHMYRCLECRACETACPSGVPFGILMEETRDMLRAARSPSPGERFVANAVFDGLLPRQRRLNALFSLLWIYQRSGLRWIVQKSGLLGWLGRAGAMEPLLPPLPSPRVRRRLKPRVPAEGETRYRVGFLSGCVMQPMFADINLATVRVLAANGCEVITPRNQTCCGAIHLHNGARDAGKRLAIRNMDVFLAEDLDAIVMNSAGCVAAFRDYAELFHDDPQHAERARMFSSKVRDVTEWLAEIGWEPPTHPIERRATYDDPCHLVHGQGVRVPPRKLLASIPGLEVVELPEADWCCGSAGIYNIVQPELSAAILRRKMEHVARTGAELLVTANPGCLLQLRAGVREMGLSVRVLHIVELLDWAYTGTEPASLRRGF